MIFFLGSDPIPLMNISPTTLSQPNFNSTMRGGRHQGGKLNGGRQRVGPSKALAGRLTTRNGRPVDLRGLIESRKLQKTNQRIEGKLYEERQRAASS